VDFAYGGESGESDIHLDMKQNILIRGSVRGPLSCTVVFILLMGAVTLVRILTLPMSAVLIPALWGLGAVLPLRAGEGDLLTFGVTSRHVKRNLIYFLLSSMVVFPLFALGFRLYVQWGFYLPVTTPFEGVPIPQWLLYNFLAVALFEELFFRGFVQGRFENWAKVKFLNPRKIIWVPILVSASLFALAHVAVYIDPLRLAVFFPGLLFGWLRARTGTLLAPILSHGTANLVSMLLIGSVS
jgi:membrane protease YdiL (CAAX protease family)